MKIFVIGLGSMGQRRIQLLKQIDKNIIIFGMDNNPERVEETQNKHSIITVKSIEAGLKEHIDCVLICTSPLSHASLIKQLLPYNLFIFTELNLIKEGYELFIKHQDKLFLSSTLLYRKDIQYIVNKCKNQKVNYIYHAGQYLPDWHPWENYKDYFVSNPKTNGCREIFAIDLPWIIAAFGRIEKMYVKKDRISSLNINYNDNYFVIFEHENGTKGMIALDVVSRHAVRKLEVYSENIHLYWDGTPQSLQDFDITNKCFRTESFYKSIDNNERYSDNIIENAYMDELIAFLNLVKHNDQSLIQYNFEKDNYTLTIIDNIEGKDE